MKFNIGFVALLLLLLFYVSDIYANCPVPESDVLLVIKTIEQSPNCYAAAEMARECSYGNSTDAKTFPAAVRVCMKDFPSPSESNQKIYDRLVVGCDERFSSEPVETHISLRSKCILKIAELFSAIHLN